MSDIIAGAVIFLVMMTITILYAVGRSHNPTPTRKPTGASIPTTGGIGYSEGVNWQPDTREPWIVTAERIVNARTMLSTGGADKPDRYEE